MKLDEKLPFLGALLKKEQDLRRSPRRFGAGRRHAGLSGARCSSLPLRAARAQGAGGHAGGAGARAGARGGPARQLARRLLPRGARAAGPHRGAPRRVRPGVPRALQGRRGRRACSSTRGAARVAQATRERSAATLTPEERGAARGARPRRRCEQLFEERLREQKERHDGGNHWIGTGGHLALRPRGARRAPGIRVGRRRAAAGSAIADRATRASTRATATTWCSTCGRSRWRCASCGRSRARARADELDLDGTIDATAKNAGELEVVTRPPRRPNTRVILLMDVGGSMDPYAQLVSRLFTRGEQGHALQGAAHLLLPQLRLRAASTRPTRFDDADHACRELLARVRHALQARHGRRRADGALRAASRAGGTVDYGDGRASRASSG